MSYNNYQYNSGDILSNSIEGVKNGLILGFLSVVIWILLAFFYYRYSLDRIKNKIITQYTNANSAKIDMSKDFITVNNIIYNTDKNIITANVFINDATTMEIVSSEKITLNVLPECNYKINCISL
jgi:hypothetical protein